MNPLLALTLHRPWALAITKYGKRVENRCWYPPKNLIGQWLAIHAGKAFSEGSALAIRTALESEFPINEAEHPRGIVAIAKLSAAFTDPDKLPANQLVWSVEGLVFWVLDEVTVFDTPVPCKGAQGLWAVKGDALEKCREQFCRPKLATTEASL